MLETARGPGSSRGCWGACELLIGNEKIYSGVKANQLSHHTPVELFGFVSSVLTAVQNNRLSMTISLLGKNSLLAKQQEKNSFSVKVKVFENKAKKLLRMSLAQAWFYFVLNLCFSSLKLLLQ